MPTSRTGSPAAGFTLVELVVVVAIVAVLAGMTVPRLASVTAGQAREDAARLLASARLARDHAATRRTRTRLMLDAEQGPFAVACEGTGEQAGRFVPLPGGLGRPVSLGKGVRFERWTISPRPDAAGEEAMEPSGPQSFVTFTPAGQADAAVVPLTDGRRTFSLLVSPGGQTRLVAQAVDELPSDRIDLDR